MSYKLNRSRRFLSKKKFFARLFRPKCCLTCLYFEEKTKHCWALWTFERFGKALDLTHLFEKPTVGIWLIGSECEAWA